MANRYWVGGSGNFSDTAHWSTSTGGSSGASVPGLSDTAIFDVNSTGTCSLTAAISITGITMNGGTGATLDTTASNYNITLSGSFVQSAGTLRLRASTMTVAGDWDTSGGGLTYDTSTVKLTGTGIIRCDHYSYPGNYQFYNLDVASSGKTTTNKDAAGPYWPTATNILTLRGGTLTGDVTSLFRIQSSNTSCFAADASSAMSVLDLYFDYSGASDMTLPANLVTYPRTHLTATSTGKIKFGVSINAEYGEVNGGTIDLAGYTWNTSDTGDFGFLMSNGGGNAVLSFNGGTLNASGGLLMAFSGGTSDFSNTASSTLNCKDVRFAYGGANSVNLGSLAINVSGLDGSGNAVVATNATITPGTSTITFTASSGTQRITSAGQTFHHVVMNNSGATLRLMDALTLDGNFTRTQGIIRLNGFNISCVDFTINNGSTTTFYTTGSHTLNSRTITVSGNCSLNGQVANLLNMNATATCTMAVTGTLTGNYLNLAFNTASVSPGIYANSTIGASVVNWSAAGGLLLQLLCSTEFSS